MYKFLCMNLFHLNNYYFHFGDNFLSIQNHSLHIHQGIYLNTFFLMVNNIDSHIEDNFLNIDYIYLYMAFLLGTLKHIPKEKRNPLAYKNNI